MLFPIYQELLNKIKSIEKCRLLKNDYSDTEFEDDEKNQEKKKQIPDLRHVLGFLNQSEWVGSLNIGNIMQISHV